MHGEHGETYASLGAREVEDRRGRRASWVALALATVALGVAFAAFRDTYVADQYEFRRVHVTRPQRAAIERRIAEAPTHRGAVSLLVTIDGLDLETWRETIASHGYRTLDSLAATGRYVTLTASRGQAGLAADLARAVHQRVVTFAIPGRATDLDVPALAASFDSVLLHRPHVTGYLDEGEASWASLRAIEAIERSPADLFAWIRYTELLPPVVLQRRFRVPKDVNEQVAIDHYLGRLLAYVRAAGVAARTRVIVTAENAGDLLVAGDWHALPDTTTLESLLAAMAGE